MKTTKKKETGITLNAIVAELAKSPHGDLKQYIPIATQAIAEQPDFYAHLVAWNQRKGQIRDAKVALPVLGLTAGGDYVENALANLALLDPRNLNRAIEFGRSLKLPASKDKRLTAMVRRYLAHREGNYAKWERVALQHRSTLKTLYVLSHYKPSKAIYGEILFDRQYPEGSVFSVLRTLRTMEPLEIAGTITGRRIPFLIALGALGDKQKDPDVLMALIGAMSPTELVTNAKRFEKAGIKKVPALRAAFEEALTKAAKSGKNILKTSTAAEAVEDEDLKEKLKNLQEKQIEKQAGIEGNWLVLADKSGSMTEAIEISRHVAATLAKFVKGQVWLVFFDTMPRGVNVTGKTYEEIKTKTRQIVANGGTSIGCGLAWAVDMKADFDGIAIVSDGGENNPPLFASVYGSYKRTMDKEPTVYFYRTKGEPDKLSASLRVAHIDVQTFDLTGSTDYYSLPNLVQSMRTNRYGLVQEIFDTPLLTLDAVLPRKEETHA